MSGEDETDLLAAEFVLGTLDPVRRGAVARRAEADPVLAAAILAWQERLAPLAELAEPVAEPAGLWDDIAVELERPRAPRHDVQIAGAPRDARRDARRRAPLARAWNSAAAWRIAAAALLAVLVVSWAGRWPTWPASPRAVGTLAAPDSATPLARAELDRDGQVRIMPLRPVPVPLGDSLALWALPAGAREPLLLGAIAPGGGLLHAPPLPSGSLVMVTLEPAAGHVAGMPPGATVFVGAVTDVGKR